MPRGKKISPVERRTWLFRYEQGAPVSAIAKEAKRAASAVRSHIAIATEEREQGEAKAHLTKNAYEDHYKDLLGIAEDIRNRAMGRTPFGVVLPADTRSRLLLDGLREHIPGSLLWDAWDAVQKAGRQLQKLEAEVRIDLALKFGTEFPEINLDGLVGSVGTFTSQSPAIEKDLEGWYRTEEQAAGLQLRWGAHLLASSVRDEARAQEIRRRHWEILTSAASLSEDVVSKYRQAFETMDAVKRAVEEEVERLLLRRVLPGRCPMCPDSVVGRVSRRRRSSVEILPSRSEQ